MQTTEMPKGKPFTLAGEEYEIGEGVRVLFTPSSALREATGKIHFGKA